MKIILPVLCLLLATSSKSQFGKLVIQLKDKQNNNHTVSNPTSYLSQKAIDRRQRFHIAIDSTDLPVTAIYIDNIRKAGNVTILSTSKWLNRVLVLCNDQDAISKIRSYSFVQSVTAVAPRNPFSTPTNKFNEAIHPLTQAKPAGTTDNSIDYGNSYNQVHIHEGEFLHNKGYQGQNIQITILDAGFYRYKNITAFDSIRINQQVLGERDFVTYDNSVNEDDTHGMYCLSILSANWPGKMVGTAPKSKYWLVRTENAATEYPIEELNWVVGAEFADSTGSDMISSSLGYNTFDDPTFDHTYSDFYKLYTTVSKGAAIAVRKGMIVMNSAGNEGNNSWKYLIFPADVDSVCSVGAVNGSGTIAGFSSRGYPGKIKPNIVSVGSGTVIAGINNEPTTGSGTSFSNPNLAGLVACLWQAFPSSTNMQILQAVYKSADRYNNPDSLYGFGIPNFRKAYQSLKHEQNIIAFGNTFIKADPNPFTDTIHVSFYGQVDGPVNITLVNQQGAVIATKQLITEKEEVYTFTFDKLNNEAPGNYYIRYSDGTSSSNMLLQKGNVFAKDYLVVAPNPFRNELNVYLKATEEGTIDLTLYDVKGSLLQKISQSMNIGETASFNFTIASSLPKGLYVIRYADNKKKRAIKVLKI